ncbi:MAG: glutamine synthetase family protein [Pseudomonadota bacterium]
MTQSPDVESIRSLVFDLNGQARGKRLPAAAADKLVSDGARMPLSALNVDIRGDDIAGSPLVFESGDRDGVLKPTERGFVPMPWLDTPTAFLPMWMFTESGAPYPGDPRQALAAVLERFARHGWHPVVATELEFYLVDDRAAELQPPLGPRSARRRSGAEILSSDALDDFDAFFTDLYAGCAAMGIPADAAISEAGTAQFEINLLHGPAMKAADDALFFKMLVKGLARRHGMAATFMAKPYPDQSGNGLHMHFSVRDAAGTNIFDDGTERGSDRLLHAIAGCLGAMAGSTLVLAPHGNSYERFTPGAHAPTGIAWAYENRTAAIRVPGGPTAARRIEHRAAGGDVNPHLLLTAVLGAALSGLEDGTAPPPPITGNAYAQDLPKIPTAWGDAMNALETLQEVRSFLPEALRANLIATKRQEEELFDGLSAQDRVRLYLETV